MHNTPTPKYIALAEQFRAQIEQKLLKPGDRLPSVSEMKAKYGVAPLTVERIYAHLEKDELIVREQGRGTFVRQRETRPPTGFIALSGGFQANSQHPYYIHLLEGCHKAATAAGVKVLLLNDDQGREWEKRVDGIVCCDARPRFRERMLAQITPHLPCVVALYKERDFVSVLPDDYQGAYELVRHMTELGHRRIACLYAPLPSARFAGYCDALRSAGIEVEESLIRTGWREKTADCNYADSGKVAMQDWLDDGWRDLRCTALVAQNDDTAIGAMHVLIAAGYRIPQDISVAGFDGTEIGRYFLPQLNSVEVPLVEIGAAAVKLLLRQIDGEKMDASTIVLPTRVLPGSSVSAPAAIDRLNEALAVG